MDQQALLVIMAVFVAISAIAMIVQAATMYGIYKSSRAMKERVDKLAPKLESLADSSRLAVEERRIKIAEISTKTNEILDSTHRQLISLEDFLDDATSRARAQMDRAE